MTITPLTAETGFVTVLLILCIKALLLGMATAARRGSLKSFLNAEDANWLKGEHLPVDPEPVSRIGRAHRNDLENLLLFAIAGAIFIRAGGYPNAGIIYSTVFLLARIGHSFAYLTARPLFRRNAYTLGFLIIAALCIHSGIAMIA